VILDGVDYNSYNPSESSGAGGATRRMEEAMQQKSIVTTTGTTVELLSRPGPGGYCFARLHGIADPLEFRDIHLDDLRAQGGTAEIEAVLEALPAWVDIARKLAKRHAASM
jgi:hypothetical protein